MYTPSENLQTELSVLPPERVKDAIRTLRQLSDTELMAWDPTELITIITELPKTKTSFLLKKAYVELLGRLYTLQKKNPAITEVSSGAWEKLKNMFGWAEAEAASPWSIRLHGKKVIINLSRLDATNVRIQPESDHGDWASMNIPFRPDENIDQYLWIIKNLPEDAQEKLADNITYTKAQVAKGGMEIHVQEAIQNPFS